MLLSEALDMPIHQSEVDFLIPNLEEDLQLYVDPFLFYKSSNPEYQAVHATIREFFRVAINKVNGREEKVAHRMLSFPEVRETMIGLSSGSHKGRGLGVSKGEIIYREIVSNDNILKNGIRHLAEMQLLIEGVGFDMISDMCTNIVKPFLVNYTQRQSEIHSIPMESGMCLQHVFDWEELDWDDEIVDLPVSPLDGNPILFVPKTVVRRFAEIDYKDFWRTTYRYILRDIETQKSLASIGREPKVSWKEIDKKYKFCKKTVVEVLHNEPELKDKYLDYKEESSTELVSSMDLESVEGADQTATSPKEFIDLLKAIEPGNKDAKKYEDLIVRILTRLFSPSLIDPHSQVRSVEGREIIDITFYNAATHGFWHDIKLQHGSLIVVFELKNMTDLRNEEYFQIASRLDDLRGKFGILIARSKGNLDLQRAYRRLHNERKAIITLTDEDLEKMLENVNLGLSNTLHINQIYRKFIEEA